MMTLDHHTLRAQGVIILDDISVTIGEGEKVAVLGPSGAGKSSLLAALRHNAHGGAAWCPQQGDLVPQLSVFHNLYMGALARHNSLFNLRNLIWPRADIRQHVGTLATELGLGEHLWQSVDRLSGGQAQRTALGRALYSQMPTLLADEPVSAVDASQGDALLRLALSRHTTVVMVLHDQHQALNHFDRILGLRRGKLVLDCPRAQLATAQLQSLYQ